MIELVLEIEMSDATHEGAIRGLVGRRAGVELIGPDEPRLEERADVDTLLVEGGPRRGAITASGRMRGAGSS